jgi:ABC-type multidrug transport system ATPase subunit
MNAPILVLNQLKKTYRRRFAREHSFSLSVNRAFERPEIIGVMGPNGAGKTTLFEMIAGSNTPSEGRVMVAGQDIHQVRPHERDRLAIHYHQSYQVRRFHGNKPAFLLRRAQSAYPLVHLFDEPQFNMQDGYIGFMLDFFRRLKSEGRLVFVCLHPTAPFQLDILKEVCDRFLFVSGGAAHEHADFSGMLAAPDIRQYLGGVIQDKR